MAEAKKEKQVFMLPEGRLINHALFERDAYQKDEKGEPGKPMYKIELVFDPKDVQGEGTIEDKLADAFEAEYPGKDTHGETHVNNWLDGKRGYWTPLLDGNDLAQKRADNGKEGDAYKGKIAIRATTGFNKDGQAGPGGVNVYAPDCSEIGATRQSEVYPGCYGIAAVTIAATDVFGDKGVKFYLVAFQKTRDGERLAKGADRSSLFKPVGGAGSAPASEGRRRRAG